MTHKRWLIILIAGVMLIAQVLNAKSLPQAMLMSAILPGTGEMYAGNLTKGFMLTTADVVLQTGAVWLNQEVQWKTDSYRQYAVANAGVLPNRTGNYYELLHNYYSSEDYNAAMELYFRNQGLVEYNNPNYYDDEIASYTISGEDEWHWSSQLAWDKYKSIRRQKQKTVIDKKLVIGALIANRIISVLDSAVMAKKYNRLHRPSFSVAPDFSNHGVILSCTLEF